MAEKFALIIDVTRSDGCGSDILEIADELTGKLNAPCDSEIPEGMAAVWMNMQEVEQGHGSKIKMDYIAKSWPLAEGAKPCEVIYDDPTMQYKWGNLDDADSCVAKFVADNELDITDVTPEGLDYKVLMYKMPKPFITGEVVDAACECAAGVKVTCTCKKCGKVFEETTDFLGDFQFKGLTLGGEYTVQVEGAAAIEVVLDEAKDLGVITLA